MGIIIIINASHYPVCLKSNLIYFQNYPRVRTLLFGSKSTNLITPNRPVSEDAEKVPEPAKYRLSGGSDKESRTPGADDADDVGDDDKNKPKINLTHHVSEINCKALTL